VATRQPTAQQVWSSGQWFVHNVDLTGQARVIPVAPEVFDRSSFLDRRIALGQRPREILLPIEELARTAPQDVPERGHYICHLSHVGSTLMSKVLGLPNGVVGLREPVLLRWLAAMEATAGEPESLTSLEQYRQNLKLGIALLNRPVEGRETVHVKATSYANPVIRDALTIQPDARVLAMFTSADTFAATILKKRGGWKDILGMAPQRMKRLHAMVGDRRWQLSTLSPGELAGMSWLAEMATLEQMSVLAGDRLKWLDFDAFLAGPGEAVPEMAAHFGIAWGADEDASLTKSGLLGQHSKRKGLVYSKQERAADLARVKAEHGDEIARAVGWIKAALAQYPALLREGKWPR